MRFVIHTSTAEPIYKQIVDQVRRQVVSGQWGAGTELPSVRGLAQEHAINPMTVSKAYSQLEAEGLLERRRGMGMVIAARPAAASLAERLALLQPSLSVAAHQAVQLQVDSLRALALFRKCLGKVEKP